MRIRDSLVGRAARAAAGRRRRIGMYVCGPTVYNRIHVGNARPFVVFQLMKRYLEWRGQPVLLVENITDINDKIYVAAARQGVPSDPLAREMSRPTSPTPSCWAWAGPTASRWRPRRWPRSSR